MLSDQKLTADLKRIAVRTSLIWGRNDLATPLSVAQTVGEAQRWPLRVIDDAGDDPAMEQPEAFLEALRAALAE
jgi:pimeloyl-ACP methyl ester carboxylesterase